MMERLMSRFGTEIFWYRDGVKQTLRGFFQPVTSRSWQKLKREISPLGPVPTGMYVYIGPVEARIREGDQLEVAGQCYILRRCEQILDRKGPIYRWGLCARKGREEA